MPVVDHLVSFRNGSQIMVRGLQLGERLGYCRNARVQVTDPTGNAANVPWAFVVPNDEHATLVCNNPAPPQWIQPGVRIRIDVQPPVVAITESAPSNVAVRLPDTPTPAPVERAAESPKSRLEHPFHVVYAVDVGAPGAGLAWACLAPQAGQIPFGSMVYDQFLDSIVRDLRADLPVALGFEAPMFLPVAPAFGDLTRARIGEPAAWSFGAGSYVTTIATPLMAFTLRHIRSQITPAPRVTLDPARWLAPDAPGRICFCGRLSSRGTPTPARRMPPVSRPTFRTPPLPFAPSSSGKGRTLGRRATSPLTTQFRPLAQRSCGPGFATTLGCCTSRFSCCGRRNFLGPTSWHLCPVEQPGPDARTGEWCQT